MECGPFVGILFPAVLHDISQTIQALDSRLLWHYWSVWRILRHLYSHYDVCPGQVFCHEHVSAPRVVVCYVSVCPWGEDEWVGGARGRGEGAVMSGSSRADKDRWSEILIGRGRCSKTYEGPELKTHHQCRQMDDKKHFSVDYEIYSEKKKAHHQYPNWKGVNDK